MTPVLQLLPLVSMPALYCSCQRQGNHCWSVLQATPAKLLLVCLLLDPVKLHCWPCC